MGARRKFDETWSGSRSIVLSNFQPGTPSMGVNLWDESPLCGVPFYLTGKSGSYLDLIDREKAA